MKDLILTASATSPFIHFKASGRLEISGKMISDEQSTFWDEITEWVKNYKNHSPLNSQIYLQIDYLNSSSLKQLNSFLLLLSEMKSVSHEVQLTWFYNDADIYMKEIGLELSNRCGIPFEMNKVKEFV
mgnify:CR=1 FL=1|tara:strand:+ start:697 stop:1080 length:384 start_codon:yes stop_codon:yes gene_type:complete